MAAPGFSAIIDPFCVSNANCAECNSVYKVQNLRLPFPLKTAFRDTETHTHSRARSYTQWQIGAYTYTCTHTHHTHTHTLHARTHAHTYTQWHIHTHTHARTRTHTTHTHVFSHYAALYGRAACCKKNKFDARPAKPPSQPARLSLSLSLSVRHLGIACSSLKNKSDGCYVSRPPVILQFEYYKNKIKIKHWIYNGIKYLYN